METAVIWPPAQAMERDDVGRVAPWRVGRGGDRREIFGRLAWTKLERGLGREAAGGLARGGRLPRRPAMATTRRPAMATTNYRKLLIIVLLTKSS
jgi:hypothetical protein